MRCELSALYLTFLSDGSLDRFSRLSALVAIAEMCSLGIVVVEPGVEIGLEGVDRLVVRSRASPA